MRVRSGHLRGLVFAFTIAIGVFGTTLPAAADNHGGPWPSSSKLSVVAK